MTRRALRIALVLALAAIAIGPSAVVRAGTSPEKLPDLAMLPPFDFHIETTTDDRRLLRFSTVSVNVGPGRFRLFGIDPNDGVADLDEILSVVQMIKHEDGSWSQRETTARMSWSGDGHDHWHLLDFQKFKLVRLDRTVLGEVAKTGFCSFDSYPYTSQRPAFFTSDRNICLTNPRGKVLMGTSRGWGDIYRWNIAFQWIDITDVPDGRYKVRVVVDPPFATGGFFSESDDANNRSWTKLRIADSSVTILDQSRNP